MKFMPIPSEHTFHSCCYAFKLDYQFPTLHNYRNILSSSTKSRKRIVCIQICVSKKRKQRIYSHTIILSVLISVLLQKEKVVVIILPLCSVSSIKFIAFHSSRSFRFVVIFIPAVLKVRVTVHSENY